MRHHDSKTAFAFRPPAGSFCRQAVAAAWAAAVVMISPILRADRLVAEPLPNPLIPGFHFPESEATLTSWISTMSREAAGPAGSPAFASIHGHAWGLWTALTMESRQFYEGQRLRVFETWLTPEDLASGNVIDTTAGRGRLRPLNQFRGQPGDRDAHLLTGAENLADRVVGFVKFDPTAASHILKQELLSTTALNRLLDGGAQQIPAFPATALVVKPVFQIVKTKDLVDGRYYCLKAWSGPPETVQTWSPVKWPGCVWIDVLGAGRGQGAIDGQGQADGSTRSDETTYPLSSLINFRLSEADAAALNQAKPGTDASEGDRALLVAMHVAGREIARWTWQTFWWTPTPDDPHPPSSTAIASLRPAQLQGAPRHYAMALAYTMLSPDQPYVGGENSGAAVYAYNPWIETRFGPADLPDSLPGLDPEGRPAANNFGVQTNCMSCHVRATYNPNQRATAPRFSGARYTDLGAAEFVGTLQVDFLWSIPRNAR
jgi:hypothetical protein